MKHTEVCLNMWQKLLHHLLFLTGGYARAKTSLGYRNIRLPYRIAPTRLRCSRALRSQSYVSLVSPICGHENVFVDSGKHRDPRERRPSL